MNKLELKYRNIDQCMAHNIPDIKVVKKTSVTNK